MRSPSRRLGKCPLDLLAHLYPALRAGLPRTYVAPLPARERGGINFDDSSQLAKAQPCALAKLPASPRSAERSATNK